MLPLSLSNSLLFQELQSEVSSLLEFKNALLNEFPHLHQKISNLGVGHPAPQDERRRSTLGLVGGLSLKYLFQNLFCRRRKVGRSTTGTYQMTFPHPGMCQTRILAPCPGCANCGKVRRAVPLAALSPTQASRQRRTATLALRPSLAQLTGARDHSILPPMPRRLR